MAPSSWCSGWKDFRFTADSSCWRISFFTEELPLRPNTGPHCINSLLMIADSRFLPLQPAYTQCHFTLLCNSDPGGGLLWIVKSHGLVTVLSTPLPFLVILWAVPLGQPAKVCCSPLTRGLSLLKSVLSLVLFWNGMSTPLLFFLVGPLGSWPFQLHSFQSFPD